MLGVIAAIYLLLALRIRISLEGAFCGSEGSFMLSAGAAGVYIRFDGAIRKRKGCIFPVLIPRYAAQRKKEKKKAAHDQSLRIARTYLWFAKTGRMEQLALHMRIGLGDAAETAVAAGAMRALASAALSHIGHGVPVDLCIMPDHDSALFAGHLRCIFSCQSGDIMLAAFKAALKKKHQRGREGLGWISIPLRA